MCFHFGKVSLPDLTDCPAVLRHLLTTRNDEGVKYRTAIRQINSNIAMASYVTNPLTERVPNEREGAVESKGKFIITSILWRQEPLNL